MPHSYIKFPRAHHDIEPWYYLTDLYAAYGFPRNLPGGGIIGIGELGGGWVQSDMDDFFRRNRLPWPSITDVSVRGAINNRDPSDDASGEVTLDVQIASSVYSYCTGKAAMVRMYWAPNDDTAIPDATKMAAADGCDVMSWSWGEDEARAGAGCQAMETVAEAATAGGMTITAAAGDNDSSDGGPTPANVDSPASCPHVLACGGTRMPRNGPETVWNNAPGNSDGDGTGGGFSSVFPIPAWQAPYFSGKTGRVVPDVAANADPATGYAIVRRNRVEIMGGTSAVAPLWAGFIAACGPKRGFINPKIWANPAAFMQAIAGDNGLYSQPPVPGPCSGMGRPIGDQFAALLLGA